MVKFSTLAALVAAIIACPASHAQGLANSGIYIPTEPALSPSGDRIVFTYQGDLWSASSEGGRAVRLTVHDAFDHGAKFSPDGESIYFMSNRFGNDDIWAMPAEGGEIERITRSTNTDHLMGVSPDGTQIYFLATRVVEPKLGRYLFSIPAEGGAARQVMDVHARSVAISPDEMRIVYTRKWPHLLRKHYRSTGTADLWLYDGATGGHTRLTDHKGQDGPALWDPKGNAVYYATDVDGTFNLWRLNLDDDSRTQVTHFEGDGVRNPAIAASGDLIAFERGVGLYVMEPGGEPRLLDIDAPGDSRANPEELMTVTSSAGSFAVAPDGKQVAMSVRGDIGVMKIDGGELNNLTDDAAAQGSVVWPKDSEWIYYISDDKGRRDIFRAREADGEPNLTRALAIDIEQVTDTPEPEMEIIPSPDGSKLAYIRDRGDVAVRDIETGDETVVITGWSEPDVRWSPDGQWIAYAQTDEEFNSDVWIVPADGSAEAVNVSMDPASDFAPAWSPDGTMLAFTSYRSDNDYDIYLVYLTRDAEVEADRKAADDVDDLTDQADPPADEPTAETAEATDEDEEAEDEFTVEIDFEDIHLRIRSIASSSATEMNPVFSPDSETIAYSRSLDSERGLWSMTPSGRSKKQLVSGSASSYSWDSKGRGLYYISGGQLKHVSTSGSSSTKGHSIVIHRDLRAERLQVFEEAWEAMGRSFYDPDMHGADWDAIRESYRPAAVATADAREFGTVMNMMLGELNSSHQGFSSRGPSMASYTSGWLGLRYDDAHAGPGLRVEWILPDGPCDVADVDIAVGDLILSIDGQTIGGNTPRWTPLENTAGKRVVVIRQRGDEVTEEIVRPAAWTTISGLCYDTLIAQRRDEVEELSDGRLAYIHVPGMSMTYVETFERDLYAEAYGKDGLIIDVRDNGGGSTADHLLAMLSIGQHAQTKQRGGELGYPQSRRPSYIWTKPIILLINENSFSNAEIFAHAVRTLGLGKLVGVTTAGGVISTGSASFVDGSSMRMPGRGWFIAGTGVDMEGNGAEPDIYVEITPEDEASGRDPQLRAAVEELLSELAPLG